MSDESKTQTTIKTVKVCRLRELLTYDAQTGLFRWLHQRGPRMAGSIAGSSRSTDGYRIICIDGVRYYAHRLAWLYHFGDWPSDQIDHINGDQSDNRISNLRECSTEENNQNLGIRKTNKSGIPNVSWDSARKKWLVQIRCGRGMKHTSGRFSSFQEACKAAARAKSAKHQFQPIQRGL